MKEKEHMNIVRHISYYLWFGRRRRSSRSSRSSGHGREGSRRTTGRRSRSSSPQYSDEEEEGLEGEKEVESLMSGPLEVASFQVLVRTM